MNTREAALRALIDIMEDGAYANLRLRETDVGVQHGAAVHALVHTTLEHVYYLDYLLLQYAKRQKRTVRNILRLATAELLYMHEPTYAVINEAVALTRRMGKPDSAALVNAVLRRIVRDKDAPPALPSNEVERRSILYSYPAWMIRLWDSELGEDMTQALLQSPATGMEIRAQYPFTVEQLDQSLSVPHTRGTVDTNCLRLLRGMEVQQEPLFLNGSMTVQNQGSMAIVRALGDMTGKCVLDACAAPGGKSAYLYSLAQGNISLTAWELHEQRKQIMDTTFARLHVQADTCVKDASVFDERYCGQFDAVLIDAPCSGLGLLRDKPDIRYNRNMEDIRSLAETQGKILDACQRYVRPGGTLLYATCTISSAENAEQIRRFLSAHDGFSLDAERQFLPPVDGIDGFYYARMTRCS